LPNKNPQPEGLENLNLKLTCAEIRPMPRARV
jgi:hypothetical protein